MYFNIIFGKGNVVVSAVLTQSVHSRRMKVSVYIGQARCMRWNTVIKKVLRETQNP